MPSTRSVSVRSAAGRPNGRSAARKFADPLAIVVGQPPVGHVEIVLKPDPAVAAPFRRRRQRRRFRAAEGADHERRRCRGFGLRSEEGLQFGRIALLVGGVPPQHEQHTMAGRRDRTGRRKPVQTGDIGGRIEDVLHRGSRLPQFGQEGRGGFRISPVPGKQFGNGDADRFGLHGAHHGHLLRRPVAADRLGGDLDHQVPSCRLADRRDGLGVEPGIQHVAAVPVAHVQVHGLRSGAMDRRRFGSDFLDRDRQARVVGLASPRPVDGRHDYQGRDVRHRVSLRLRCRKGGPGGREKASRPIAGWGYPRCGSDAAKSPG